MIHDPKKRRQVSIGALTTKNSCQDNVDSHVTKLYHMDEEMLSHCPVIYTTSSYDCASPEPSNKRMKF